MTERICGPGRCHCDEADRCRVCGERDAYPGEDGLCEDCAERVREDEEADARLDEQATP